MALAVMWPALGSATRLNAYQDAQHFTLFEEAARIAVVRYREFPFWDPYYCGGISALGTPSARFVAPSFLFSVIFGSVRGAALTCFGMTVIGLEGAFRYARARGGSVLGAVGAAPVFALSGLFAQATLLAWTNFYGFELAPWALLGVHHAVRGSRRGVVLTGLAMAWMIGFGGTYTAPLTALACAYEVVSFGVASVRRPSRVVFAGAMALAAVALGVSLAMVRLWPIVETLSASPRLLGGRPGTPLGLVWRSLFGAWSNRFGKGDFLIGLGVLPLALFGATRRRGWLVAGGACLWLWFAVGYDASPSIFAALRTVPPYTMLRAPERFLLLVAVAASTLAAVGIRRIEAAMRRRPRWVFALLASNALLLADAYVLVGLGQSKADARKMDPELPKVIREFRQARGNRWLAAYYPMMSRGTLTCFDDYDVAQSPRLRGDLPHEEYVRDGAGTVERLRWSPDRIALMVTLPAPSRLYVNQNWHPGWRASIGTVVAEDGLLAVDLPAGSYPVSLWFCPRSGVGGLTTSMLGLAAVAFVLLRARRGDSVAGYREWVALFAWSAAPLLVIPTSMAWIHEPPRPPPPLLTPAGEPMLVDAPPEDATPIGAVFEGGVRLEAARITVDEADTRTPEVTVELDFRFDGPVPPGLGVFLQFDRPGGRFSTDHVRLSGVLVPESAPLHTVIRDVAAPVRVPWLRSEGTWTVYAGVWRARRDMNRLHVEDAGQATVDNDRVVVGTVSAR